MLPKDMRSLPKVLFLILQNGDCAKLKKALDQDLVQSTGQLDQAFQISVFARLLASEEHQQIKAAHSTQTH